MAETKGPAGDGANAAPSSKAAVLSPEKVEHFRDAYNIFDKNGDGGVGITELGHVMRCLGLDPSDDEVRRMFDEVDVDGSGEISFEEFLEIMAEMSGESSTEKEPGQAENWAEAFKIFDLDGDGFVTAAELGKVLENMGEPLKDYELQEMIDEVDKDKDGKLNLEEFVHVMAHGLDG
ncbi:Calmodulin [Hondaea fermentalgiana]|uniref:Calmodulin n=1 Tax=Hondaea fermentalgiana TaxID=2315210 RepID=A0A2R5GUS0_9STRA|nr:Calmodulin [Hondaea fermentalgiana]|eukprot:GBG33518.1 Calmodulin [Hondaea fermentalgiana]